MHAAQVAIPSAPPAASETAGFGQDDKRAGPG